MKKLNSRSSRKIALAISYIFFVVNTIVSIFVSSFVVRSVGKTDYGVYQSMTAFVSYLILLEFGTGSVMSRNISMINDGNHKSEIQQNFTTIWFMGCFLSAIILCFGALFFLIIPAIYSNTFTTEQIILGRFLFFFSLFSLIFSFLQNTLNGALLGNEIYLFEKVLMFIKLIIRTSLIIVFLTIKHDIILLVMIDSVMSFSTLFITFLFVKTRLNYHFFDFSSFSPAILKAAIPLCFAMLLQTIVNTVNGSLDKFLISVTMSPEDVAVYSIAMSMFTMFSSVATLPVSIFKPQIAKSIVGGKTKQELSDSLIEPCRLNLIITGLIAFGFFCVGKQFIILLYGNEYIESWICAIIVIFPTFIHLSTSILLNVLDILNKRHKASVISLFTTILNLLLTLLFIKWFGLVGAAAATGIATLIQFFLLNMYYSKTINIPIFHLLKHTMSGILLPLVFSSIIVFILNTFLPGTILQLFIGGLIFLFSFFLFFFLFGANEDEKNRIKRILNKALRIKI